MTQQENNPTYLVPVPPEVTEELTSFLKERGVDFQPSLMAIRMSNSGDAPQVVMAHEAPELLQAVNKYLREKWAHPPGARMPRYLDTDTAPPVPGVGPGKLRVGPRPRARRRLVAGPRRALEGYHRQLQRAVQENRTSQRRRWTHNERNH